LALAGFPLLSGFFSKDEIIYGAFASERGSAVLGVLALITVALTGFYVFRAFFLAFHGESHVDPKVAHHMHKPGASMTGPVAILAVLAALGGYIQYIGGSGAIDRWLAPVFDRYTQPVPMVAGAEQLQQPLMVVSVTLGLLGILVAYLMYVVFPQSSKAVGRWYPNLYRLLLNKYYIDELYSLIFVRTGRWVGGVLSGGIDGFLTDGIVRGTARTVQSSALGLRRLQSGFVRDYALAILGGATLILFYLLQVGGIR
jgi:NADH-quinone oxidoreductase subunit L